MKGDKRIVQFRFPTREPVQDANFYGLSFYRRPTRRDPKVRLPAVGGAANRSPAPVLSNPTASKRSTNSIFSRGKKTSASSADQWMQESGAIRRRW